MGQYTRFRFLWHQSAAKVLVSLRLYADSPEPRLLTYMKYGCKLRLRPKFRPSSPGYLSMGIFKRHMLICAKDINLMNWLHIFSKLCVYNLGDIGELEGLRIELEDSRDMLEQEKRSRTTLERKLQELEQILDDQRIDSENIQHTLTAKVRSSLVELATNASLTADPGVAC